MKTLVNIAATALVAVSLVACLGCGKHDHGGGEGHDHAGDHDHGAPVKDAGGVASHGEARSLGEQTVGGFTVVATREGNLAAAGEMSARVKFTGGTGKVAVVRLWVGAEDGRGAIKVKADFEGDAWHGHAETPAALQGARLWVEFETEAGAKATAGFDLVK